jgi:hypothetical protein
MDVFDSGFGRRMQFFGGVEFCKRDNDKKHSRSPFDFAQGRLFGDDTKRR